jgi:hypothetical protein
LKFGTRADFLNNDSIETRRGLRALVQGKIPVGQDQSGVQFCHSYGPVFREVCKLQAPTAPAQFLQSLTRFKQTPRDDQTMASLRRARSGEEQLTLDLSLSADVACSKGVVHPADTDPTLDDLDRMSLAAGNLNLHNEPPVFSFSFLHATQPDLDPQDVTLRKSPNSQLAVRVLLAEWDVTCKPNDYDYIDPYEIDPSGVVPPTTARRRQAIDRRLHWQPTSTHGPSLIAPARLESIPKSTQSSIPAIFGRSAAQTQPVQPIVPTIVSSQALPSTQPFPRAVHSKPKPAKKRIGGF